jgi:hypothetical protein
VFQVRLTGAPEGDHHDASVEAGVNTVKVEANSAGVNYRKALWSLMGDLPVHRWWNLGGWQTIRGFAGGQQRGTAYGIARAEVAMRRGGWL